MDERWIALIDDLRTLPAETEWVEFKHNNADPAQIGKRMSALSNVACIWGQQFAYIVWGIEDGTHKVVGTTFEPKTETKGAEPLELWLAKALAPSPSFKFVPIDHPDGRVVLLEIPAANTVPAKFNSIAYIRVGSTTPKLADFPKREEDLLSKLRPFVWEHAGASNFIPAEQVLRSLDYETYFRLIKVKQPETTDGVLEHMRADNLIAPDVGGRWNILNLGAILFARNLNLFPLGGKVLRVVQYEGDTRSRTKRSRDGVMGYAAGFSGALQYIDGLLPAEERIEQGIRTSVRSYPQIAIRELVANALIHQDMTVTGVGPLVEVFDNRVEVSNPGIPVTDMIQKLFGAPPRSRNEQLGRLMRRMGICEELGSGLVKVIEGVEDQRLPPPSFYTVDESTRVELYGPRPFVDLARSERITVCYQHACLMSHRGKRMTNSSLRARFGIGDEAISQVSRIIKEALEAKQIKHADPDRQAGYLPWWG